MPAMTRATLPTPAEALAITETVIASRYPDAAFAFAAGSIMRGEGTIDSDIGWVGVLDRGEASRRESFLFEGRRVEAFVHGGAPLAGPINSGAARGRPSSPAMIAEATVFGRMPERGER